MLLGLKLERLGGKLHKRALKPLVGQARPARKDDLRVSNPAFGKSAARLVCVEQVPGKNGPANIYRIKPSDCWQLQTCIPQGTGCPKDTGSGKDTGSEKDTGTGIRKDTSTGIRKVNRRESYDIVSVA